MNAGPCIVAGVKKLLAIVVIGGAAVLMRRHGPQMGERFVEHCEHMFDEMPDSFPPKRMMSSLDAIREQNERTLALLERLAAKEEASIQ